MARGVGFSGRESPARVFSPQYRWWVVLMLWGMCFFNYADRQAVFSVFPLLQREFHLGLIELGLLGSAFAWIYGLGAPLAGLIVDRIRRKSAILTGLHLWSAICIATGFSRTFRQLLLLRAAEGLGETIYYPAATSMIGDYHSRGTRSRALGILVTGVYAGTVAGGYFAGLIGQAHGWRWSFIVFGSSGILLGLALQKFLREPARGLGAGSWTNVAAPGSTQAALPVSQTLRLILGSKRALLLMGAFVCANFVAVVLLSWMPSFLFERFHLDLAAAGLSATIFAQLGSLLGALGGGWWADVLIKSTPRGRLIVQIIGVLGGAPFVALCGNSFSLGLVALWLFCWGFFKGLYDANIFASAFDVVAPEARGSVAGMMNCVGWLGGGGVAPVVIGMLAQRFGLGTAIGAASGIYLLAAVLLLICMAGTSRSSDLSPTAHGEKA